MPPQAQKQPCRGCRGRHQSHTGVCRGKEPSSCQRAGTSDGGVMIACGVRPRCRCPWRECPCGTPVAVAVELPRDAQTAPAEGQVMLVAVVRGTAGKPGGRLAVRELADGYLACRDLAGGEEPGEDEWRGTEHQAPGGGDCPHERKILHV